MRSFKINEISAGMNGQLDEIKIVPALSLTDAIN
jgi:hypothetical protein